MVARSPFITSGSFVPYLIPQPWDAGLETVVIVF
jgi:hypothetical protein